MPDMIIHKRFSDENNLVVVEFKKGDQARDSMNNDIEKLRYFTSTEYEYGYKYGFHVVLDTDKARVKVFQDGAERPDKAFCAPCTL